MRKISSFRQRALLLVVMIFAASVFAAGAVPATASAADGRSFNPGNILSDQQFYNGSAMTAPQVQAFLEAKVSRCTIGDPGRQPGTPYGNTKVANNCLRDMRMTTPSKPANAFCSTYSGAVNETAAQVIARVGKACNISQQTLLVLLQKEQGLVTDTWPYELQYRSATGYGCPDTAPCDAEYYGFFNQVYKAAWTFGYYRANPTQYNYQAGRTNTIYWHPNAACGTSRVHIENSATAALYIYTPYRPNQAALNAGYGTGDACSSYGNRNFYLYFTDWFGTPDLSVHPRIKTLVDQVGTAYGTPVAAAVVLDAAGSISQQFSGGTFYWSPSAGASVVSGGIRSFHTTQGGVAGYLSFPRGTQQGLNDGTWLQQFVGGTVYWRPGATTVSVTGGLRSFYNAAGAHAGYLRYPLELQRGRTDGAWWQQFQGGTVYWLPGGNTNAVTGGIRAFYNKQNGPDGYLRYPTGPELGRTDGAWWQQFQGGTVYWLPGGNTNAVTGGIRAFYNKQNGPDGYLRYPTGPELGRTDGAWWQQFQGGQVYWTPSGGTHAVSGAVLTHYLRRGGPDGELGYPVSAMVSRGAGVWAQEFQKGTLVWSPDGTSTVERQTQRSSVAPLPTIPEPPAQSEPSDSPEAPVLSPDISPETPEAESDSE